MWILKNSVNDFQVTREGEFEYHTFKHGEIYARIPKEEADRFEALIETVGDGLKPSPKNKGGEDE